MDLSASRSVAPRLVWLDHVGSTNAHLSGMVTSGRAVDGTVVATDNQTAGRGRLDRAWTTPPHTSLAVSVARRTANTEYLSLLPLVVGSALASTIRPLLPHAKVAVKWPNDIHIDGKKVAGILCELVTKETVIIGAGINLSMTTEELPIETATSLALCGALTTDMDTVLSGYLTELFRLTDALLTITHTQELDKILGRIRDDSATLGKHVSVYLPDGSKPSGIAQDIDPTGRLIVSIEGTETPLVVSAGDVVHLR